MRISDWSSDVCSSDLLDTSPDVLVEDFLGSYLAIVAGADGSRILRDPTGLMPCYIREFEDNIFLASDVAALDAARSGPCGVDWDRLSEFLQTPGIRRRATCPADLEELPPGVLNCFGSDGRSERRLWTPWRFTGRSEERRVGKGWVSTWRSR